MRGILGYEEASPAAEASVSIADAFFRNLAAKMTFYDAWKAANHGQNWAAIVHDDATGDTLHGWGAAPPLRGSEISKYRGSASKAPAQQVAIAEAARPFVVRIFREDAAAGEITAATLDSGAAWLQPGGRFTLDVTAPHDFKRVDIQWVHIRPTFRQFDVNAVFARVEAPGAAEPVIPAAKKLQSVVYDVPRKHVRVTFVARDADGLEASGLEEHHSYLWPSVRLDDGAERVDARERGLLYYGVPQTRDL